MNKNLLRPCPICDNTIGEILHCQIFSLNPDSLLPQKYDVVSCIHCGFTFADTPASQEVYDKFYVLQSKYEDRNTGSGGGFTSYDKKRLDETADEIVRQCPDKNASILDLGCANGGLLRALKERGYNNLCGLDPSEKCVKEVRAAGINCENGSLFNVSQILRRKFDFIILTHVMEHICDLKMAMLTIDKVMNKNGLLYIEVPDAGRYAQFYKVPYYYFDIEHINHFDSVSLSNLGLIISCQTISKGSKNLTVSNSELYPAVFVVLQKKFSEQATRSIKQHIKDSSKEIKNENVCIHDLIKSQQDTIIFGIGNHTRRMLVTTDLSKCNIVCFVDNDTSKQKHQCTYINAMDGTSQTRDICNAEVIKNFNGTVVICSAIHSVEIEKQVAQLNPNAMRIVLK
jgi:SAM-dependent methyltransferase